MSGEREFDAYLEGDDDLSRRYRDLPATEPPAGLDTSITRAAHRAARADSDLDDRVGAHTHWAVPVGLAAALVLAVGVVFQVARYGPQAPPPPAVLESAEDSIQKKGTADEDTLGSQLRRTAPAADAAAPPFSTDADAEQTAAPVHPAERMPRASEPGRPTFGARARENEMRDEAAADPANAARKQQRTSGPAETRYSLPESDTLEAEEAASSGLAEQTALPPSEWIERLRALKDQPEAYARAYAAFRRQYPDTELPDDLPRP